MIPCGECIDRQPIRSWEAGATELDAGVHVHRGERLSGYFTCFTTSDGKIAGYTSRGNYGESCCPCHLAGLPWPKTISQVLEYMDTTAITADRKRSREAIRITLAHRAGGAPDVHALAEATISTWRQVDSLLAPVIGTHGVDVIFRRALYLTSKTFPWLAFSEECRDSSVLLASLKAHLENQCAVDVAEAGCTLLACFTELLTTLIGEALTERVMGQVWAFPSSSSEQEIES